MKKVKLIGILSVIIILTVLMFAGCAGDTDDAEKDALYLHMEEMGYDTKTIKEAMENVEEAEYTTSDGTESIVRTVKLANGDEIQHIVEGELENFMIIKANGDIYLDGSKVTIKEAPDRNNVLKD